MVKAITTIYVYAIISSNYYYVLHIVTLKKDENNGRRMRCYKRSRSVTWREKEKSPSNLLVRECIVEAMIKLIYEKPLSAITISELTERAGVSRMTFYRNYGSKEDVWKDELADLVGKLCQWD